MMEDFKNPTGSKVENMDENRVERAYGLREIQAIAVMEGCFPEKFGIPRQAGIAKSAQGIIRLLPPYNHENYLHGLELSSHVWLTFGFHQNVWNGKATVRPQRLGGNQRMGVFATRSSFRPNGLGLSAVKIETINWQECTIEVSGHDLMDGTPIYCIKPYVPFSDSLREAKSEFAVEKPVEYKVCFSPEARKQLHILAVEAPYLEMLICEVIGQNPTPQFHHDLERVYGVSLKSWNILFKKVKVDQGRGKTVLDQVDDKHFQSQSFLVTEINPRKVIMSDTP